MPAPSGGSLRRSGSRRCRGWTKSDRTLLALRFYENKTGAEAGALLGIRE